jgi:hypothetical protein
VLSKDILYIYILNYYDCGTYLIACVVQSFDEQVGMDILDIEIMCLKEFYLDVAALLLE